MSHWIKPPYMAQRTFRHLVEKSVVDPKTRRSLELLCQRAKQEHSRDGWRIK